ncbi:MAG: flagellar motor protein MotB, partial [Pedobacter sp.]|nr:flagellar motor protein MotB [Chitinophagaceae bacterium]
QSTIAILRADSTMKADKISQMNQSASDLKNNVSTLQSNLSKLESAKNTLQQQLDATKNEASNRLNASQQQINRSKEQIANQQQRLAQLQALIDQQKQNTENIRKKMADALVNFNANELSVHVKDGKVYVSLQESLLFPSGSATVNPKGKQAISQLAQVLNNNQDINVNIQGHTDSIPIKGRFEDNWALSVARATSIVRVLTNTYNVNPVRVTASGRSWYEPIDDNFLSQGRANNRRTEIILEPKLDELMKLIQQ